mgnify:FL=1
MLSVIYYPKNDIEMHSVNIIVGEPKALFNLLSILDKENSGIWCYEVYDTSGYKLDAKYFGWGTFDKWMKQDKKLSDYKPVDFS